MRERAIKLLSEAQFNRSIRATQADLDALNSLIHGAKLPRHAAVKLGAIRTKLEWGHAKPKTETELTGALSIVVQSPLPGPPGGAPQHLVPSGEGNSARLADGLINGDYVANTTSSGARMALPVRRQTDDDARSPNTVSQTDPDGNGDGA